MSKRVLMPFAVAIVAVGALAVYLFIELSQTNTTLAATTADLTETRAVLAETDGALTGQKAKNAEVEAANAVLTANLDDALDTIDAWSAANAALTANLDDALGAIDEWQVAFAQKEKDLSTTNAELAKTETELAETASELIESRSSLDALGLQHRRLQTEYGSLVSTEASLRQDYNALTSDHSTLQTAHTALVSTEAALRQDYNALVEQYGDVESLQNNARTLREEIAELEGEIAELEDKRRPLVLSVHRVGFACTGSMEPKITCLDEATWLDNPRPEDITVGATISFNPDCWEDEPDNTSTAHRVMDIKIENGVYYYWPQGDASDRPDGCWVPFDHVNGYIVEIHKDVRPENAELRRLVNAAADAYGEAETAYYTLRDRHCPNRDAVCTVPSPTYERLVALRETLVAALDHYNCWLESARNAIHRKGEQPIYRHCLQIIS